MALSDAQLAKYGLSRSSASSSNHDKGIVQGPAGNYYQIEGFKHGQKDGLDKDKGATFKTSLQADTDHQVSNFNTAGDVEGALQKLLVDEAIPEPVEANFGFEENLSPEPAKAFAYVDAYEDFARRNDDTDVRFGNEDEQSAAAQRFADEYKEGVKKRLAPGFELEEVFTKDDKEESQAL